MGKICCRWRHQNGRLELAKKLKNDELNKALMC
jgi:hypothetical protein